mmetsp:Transcript_1351/g.3583  ORF Transcript_1351/g.3583 Transcript_1351/m.3583 type:complete len:225 (+) Transcript_1351:641-1315(+)
MHLQGSEDPVGNDDHQVDEEPSRKVPLQNQPWHHNRHTFLHVADHQGHRDIQRPEAQGDPIDDLEPQLRRRVERLNHRDHDQVPEDEGRANEIPRQPGGTRRVCYASPETTIISSLRPIAFAVEEQLGAGFGAQRPRPRRRAQACYPQWPGPVRVPAVWRLNLDALLAGQLEVRGRGRWNEQRGRRHRSGIVVSLPCSSHGGTHTPPEHAQGGPWIAAATLRHF